MSAAAFDTHAAVRSLEAAGIETRHAEAIVSTVGEAAAADQTELATKAGLATAIADLKADMLIKSRKRLAALAMRSRSSES